MARVMREKFIVKRDERESYSEDEQERKKREKKGDERERIMKVKRENNYRGHEREKI